MANVYAVIMAGGAGTRFWPASRAGRPKQLLPLAGRSDEPLLAATVRRIASLVPPERVYVATGQHLLDATAACLPAVPRAQLLAEPVPRNTAPCIGWAVRTIQKRDPDAVVAVLPSDHFIKDEAAFVATLARAIEAARGDEIVTVGIGPTRPETGYGYIELGPEKSTGVSSVHRFVEKPDLARAKEYVAGGKHLWNAGMFFFRASVMTAAIDQHLPELGRGLAKIDAEAAALATIFPTLPSISIDHGVMEKAANVSVVRGDFGWNDVGGWQSAWELADKDADGNALPEGAIAVDARGNLVRDLGGNKRVIALVGVSDLVVVDTGDALLVIPRDRAQDVRAIVDALKAQGKAALF
jgi:mannose-1-phosphate guanylyltransferase